MTTTKTTTTTKTAPARTRTAAPSRAKAPQDRRPPAPKVTKTDDGQRVTLHGVTVTVREDALDDFEVLDDLGALDSGNASRLPGLLRRLLGDEDYQSVLEALRDASGRVRIQPATEFLRDLLGAIRPSS